MQEHKVYLLKIIIISVISLLFVASLLYLLPMAMHKDVKLLEIPEIKYHAELLKEHKANLNNIEENNENIDDDSMIRDIEEPCMEGEENEFCGYDDEGNTVKPENDSDNIDENLNDDDELIENNPPVEEVKLKRRYLGKNDDECREMVYDCNEEIEHSFWDETGCGCEELPK